MNQIELLFHILRCFTSRYITHFQFFRDYLEQSIASRFSVEWKRMAFFKFVDIFHDQTWPKKLKAKILQHIIMPCFASCFEKGESEALIGGAPAPELDSDDNVISVFIERVIDPDDPFGTSDALRILLLQFSSLLVDQASAHIHDAANKCVFLPADVTSRT